MMIYSIDLLTIENVTIYSMNLSTICSCKGVKSMYGNRNFNEGRIARRNRNTSHGRRRNILSTNINMQLYTNFNPPRLNTPRLNTHRSIPPRSTQHHSSGHSSVVVSNNI